MSQSVSSLPKFIHIATGVQHGGSTNANVNAKANASHPPPCTPPPNALYKYKTPRKGLLPRRGILKSPSYKFTGIRSNSNSNKAQKKQKQQLKQQEPSTPTTVGTNESFEESDSISRSSSCGSSTIGSTGTFGTTSSEGIKKAIDRIIRDKTHSISLTNKSININITKNSSSSSIDKTNNNSMSSSVISVTSKTTSSTSVSTSSVCSNDAKEELQRCARIKHIEDLNERINNAKARKLVERKAYKREDKLLLRLARQLKTVSKRSRDNAIGIQMVRCVVLCCVASCLHNYLLVRGYRVMEHALLFCHVSFVHQLTCPSF